MANMVNTGLFSKHLIIGFLLVFVQILAAPPALKTINELPSNIPSCKENDPNLNDCILKGLQFAVSKFKTGMPEINVPVMDPFLLEKANFQLANNLLNGKIALRNLQIKGLSGVQIQEVDYQNKNNALQLKGKGSLPYLHVQGKHRANADAGTTKVTSKGEFDLTLKDIDFTFMIDSKLTERDGHQYMTVDRVDFNPTIGNLKLQATGLLPEPSLNDAVVDSINQNWQQFYKVLLNDAKSTWEPVFIKHINNFSAHLPYDLLVTRA